MKFADYGDLGHSKRELFVQSSTGLQVDFGSRSFYQELVSVPHVSVFMWVLLKKSFHHKSGNFSEVYCHAIGSLAVNVLTSSVEIHAAQGYYIYLCPNRSSTSHKKISPVLPRYSHHSSSQCRALTYEASRAGLLLL